MTGLPTMLQKRSGLARFAETAAGIRSAAK
jgi:hypothetical protein